MPAFPALSVLSWADLPPTALEAWRALESFALQLSLWEAAVVAVYASVMAALSLFGLHRAALTKAYFAGEPARLPAEPARLPSVTVQLPLYNERYVVERLIEAVAALDYPRELLEIQVLDDSTDDTTAIAAAAVERFAARGVRIRLLHRDNREGFKAGALAAGLEQARGELVAVFDADFLPERDFLLRAVGAFDDPRVGAVQARWTYRNRDESLLTRVQAMLLDGHFVFEQGGRSRAGLFFNFNGTAGVLRRSMIEDAGGWQGDTLTEDTELSYRAQLRGWRFVYFQDLTVPSELPSEMASFQVQQARWAKGLVQTGLKLSPSILRSGIAWRLKAEALFHLFANLSYPLMTLLAAAMLPSMVVRFRSQEPWLLLLDGPVFLATFGSLAVFYLAARRQVAGSLSWSDLGLFPMALAAGIGLTFSNTQAVMEALLGVRSPFMRTAKTAERGSRRVSTLYRPSVGWLPWANLAAAGYFLGGFLFAVSIGNWGILPFLALFVTGFGYAGGLAILQSIDRDRPEAAQSSAAEARS